MSESNVDVRNVFLKLCKCSLCGEPLPISKAVDGVVKCDTCRSEYAYTLPKENSKAMFYLYQGSLDLDKCRFADAYVDFTKAIEADPQEPEAYWGRALATEKVQYLKDLVNKGLQPICHEVTSRKFTDNSDYKKVLDISSPIQQTEYKKKAQEIDYIRNEFLNLKNSGLKYDTFICVKVTTNDNKLTMDYRDALAIHNYLKGKGFTPFFSEIDLAGKLGADYEARILYALFSADSMIVICSNRDYLQTPWVKNEYTRFLKMIDDEGKDKDSITILYRGEPIERLEGKNGKIQGIDLGAFSANENVMSFVSAHSNSYKELLRKKSDEAKEKAVEAEKAREAEVEALRKQNEELLKKFNDLQSSSQSSSGNLSPAELLKMMRQAEEEESERKVKEEAERIARKEAERQAREEAESKIKIEIHDSNFEIDNGKIIKYIGTSNEVIIPDKVRSVGEKAFKDCKGITSITIPSSVKSFGAGAFAGCSSISRINYLGSIEQWCSIKFADCESNPGIESISCSLYINKKLVEKLVIPYSITEIGDYLFVNCACIESVEIHDRVTTIGKGSFYGCGNMTELTFDGNVYSIGEYAFGNCESLANVAIPNGVKTIEQCTFSGCESLESVSIPDGVTSIGELAFCFCNNLKSVILPYSVTSIADNAFDDDCEIIRGSNYNANNDMASKAKEEADRKQREELARLEKERAERAKAEAERKAKEEAERKAREDAERRAREEAERKAREEAQRKPKGVAQYSKNDFEIDGTSLVKYIGKGGDIVIPDGIERIEENAFSDSTNIKSVTIPESVTVFKRDCFFIYELLSDFEKTKSFNVYYNGSLESWCKIEFSNFNSNPARHAKNFYMQGKLLNNTSLTIPNNRVSIANYTFQCFKFINNITIPNSIKKIGEGAFMGCENLKSIVVPNTVTSIGIAAFQRCDSLTSITIPDGITSIADNLFMGCASLKNITIPVSVESIGDGAFYGCGSLKSITIPGNVARIEGSAFGRCKSLTDIIIPRSVNFIGYNAFRACNGLKSIIIPTSVTTVGESLFLDCENITVYCRVQKKPDGWNENWNVVKEKKSLFGSNRCKVVWGYNK